MEWLIVDFDERHQFIVGFKNSNVDIAISMVKVVHQLLLFQETGIDTVCEIIEMDQHVTYPWDWIPIDMKQIHTIVHEHLNVNKLCAQFSHNLTNTQKKNRTRIKWCKEMLKKFSRESLNLICDIITCDETWIYSYKPKIKRQSAVWIF